MMRSYKKFVVGYDDDGLGICGEDEAPTICPAGIRIARKRLKEFSLKGAVIYKLVPVKEK